MSFSDFELQYALSPIIFVNGIAAGLPGGLLPITEFTQPKSFVGVTGVVGGLKPENYFCQFMTLPGSTLADNDIGQYPFANQFIAANAIITKPLRVSLRMICPARTAGGTTAKWQTMTALQKTVSQHVTLGGTFVVATPAIMYQNLLLMKLWDVSSGETKLPQVEYQWDFYQPVVTSAQATAAMNSTMNKISSGVQIKAVNGSASWSGPQQGVGNQQGGLGASTVSGATPLIGSHFAGAGQ